jgi:heptosyltransferase-3
MRQPAAPQVLVIHPGALGDVLQALPALRGLRERWPGATIAVAAQPRIGRLLAGAGATEAWLPFDGLGLESLFVDTPLSATLRQRLEGFDRIVSWFGARADVYPRRLAGVGRPVIVAPPVPDADAPGGAQGGLPVWAHLLGTLGPWGVEQPRETPPIRPPASWREEARAALHALGVPAGRPFLLVHPGAGGREKRWPAERYAEVFTRIAERSAAIVLHQGPADHEAVQGVEHAFGRPLPRLVEPSLEGLTGALQMGAAFLGGDSGVSHLAAATGAPSVILFPPATAPRWAPWSESAMAVTIAGDPEEPARVADLVCGLLDR